MRCVRNDDQGPILVTGCPRSGTTWVGRVLGAERDIRYSREPFHPSTPHPGTQFEARGWFEYLDPAEVERIAQLATLCTGRPRPFARLNRRSNPPARLRWRWQELLQWRAPTLNIVKDPLAINSAETLAEAFGMRVVFMVRKPEKVLESFLKHGWDFDIAAFVSNMRPLSIFDQATLDSAEEFRSLDVADRISQMWRLLSIRARGMQERQPDWIFCRHEDLIEDPDAGFIRLCEKIGIDFGDEMKRFLERANQRPRDSAAAVDALVVNRSIDDLRTEATTLSPETLQNVLEICGEERRHWYPDSEMELA